MLATLVGEAISPPASTLNLPDNLISLQSIKDRMSGVQVLRVGKSSVITPAVRDLCKELRVEIVRDGVAASSSSPGVVASSKPQRILVAGTSIWLPAVAKQLCSKQAQVMDIAKDDSSALRFIAEGVRNGHQAGMAIVQSPHAVCWQAARDDRLRPAVVANWLELGEVLREVPVNLLILSSKTWNVPSACNTARRFFQHLQGRS